MLVLVAFKVSDMVSMTWSASDDAVWSEGTGVSLVLSMLGETLGSLVILVAVEVIGDRGWRRSCLSMCSFLAASDRESSSSFRKACISDFRSVMVDSKLDAMDL